jgi:polyhydroxyalkanoate synthesis regulator phasin
VWATAAQSADAIIDKLVDKGILTVDEATQLKEDVR